jgi:hypothetical protein
VEPDAWLLVRPILKSEPAAEAHVRRQQRALETALAELALPDVKVLVLDGEQYPDLDFARPVHVVAVGPFASADEAEAACAGLRIAESGCLARQPGVQR